MNDLPLPLVGLDVDLKGFSGFVLDVESLLASELVALATPEEISAALMLWCRAWQQTPHGSLPNDERVLSAFSRAKNWKKVRDMAMRGFILCSDGRFYHKFLCEKVLDAWETRKAYIKKREKDADRLRDWRDKKQSGNTSGNDSETRFNDSTKPLRREEEEKGSIESTSVPTGTGASLPGNVAEQNLKKPAGMTKEELWSAGKSLLVNAGMPIAQCGSYVGKLCKDYGDDIVIEAVRTAVVKRPADPASFLKATCQHLKGERKPTVQWWASDETINAKAAELGLKSLPGESMPAFKARIETAIAKASTPTPNPTPTPDSSTTPVSPTPAPTEGEKVLPELAAQRSAALKDALKLKVVQ